MVPDGRERFMELIMVKDVIAAAAVKVVCVRGNPINGKPNAILLRDIGIKAAIVLRGRKFGLIDGEVVRNVGNGAQVFGTATAVSARARVTWASPTGVLPCLDVSQREQRRIQRCADVQPSRDFRAIRRAGSSGMCRINQPGSCASGVRVERSNDSVTREREILSGDASRRRQGGEGRGFEPAVSL